MMNDLLTARTFVLTVEFLIINKVWDKLTALQAALAVIGAGIVFFSLAPLWNWWTTRTTAKLQATIDRLNNQLNDPKAIFRHKLLWRKGFMLGGLYFGLGILGWNFRQRSYEVLNPESILLTAGLLCFGFGMQHYWKSDRRWLKNDIDVLQKKLEDKRSH